MSVAQPAEHVQTDEIDYMELDRLIEEDFDNDKENLIMILQAIQNQDYFLLQGCFLFLIVGVLLANFLIDIVYVIVDPRTRRGMQGE